MDLLGSLVFQKFPLPGSHLPSGVPPLTSSAIASLEPATTLSNETVLGFLGSRVHSFSTLFNHGSVQ